MQKIIKSKILFYNSNKFNYGQLLINKNIILTIKSSLLTNYEHDYSYRNKTFNKCILLFNNKIISYNSLNLLCAKNYKTIKVKDKYRFSKLLTELIWESGVSLRKL
jgi:uncharacterized cysteine cluster protein YcgN (CxxCxxCC family)